eukprot:2272113-Lingulodinium_polyedra.AAC.1
MVGQYGGRRAPATRPRQRPGLVLRRRSLPQFVDIAAAGAPRGISVVRKPPPRAVAAARAW